MSNGRPFSGVWVGESRKLPEMDDMKRPKRELELPQQGRGRAERAESSKGVASKPAPTGVPLAGGPARPVSVAQLEAIVSPPTVPAIGESNDYRVLRCVASGYMSRECSCKAGVPARAVVAAWGLERRHDRRERFFTFMWRGQTWLAYGLRNGCVRGVYCPEHRAERDERATLGRLESIADRQPDPVARSLPRR
jgi:hypothetical protein